MKIGQSAEHIFEFHNHPIQIEHLVQNQDGSLGCHGNDIYQDESVDCKHNS